MTPGDQPTGSEAERSAALDADERTIAAAKAIALGRIARWLAHDVRSHLTGLGGFARLLRDDPGVPEDLRRGAALLEGSVRDLGASVLAFLDYARSRPAGRTAVTPGGLLDDVRAVVGHEHRLRRVDVVADPELPAVEADASRLRDALVLLALLALDAAEPRPDGPIRLLAATAREGGREVVRLTVEHDGPTAVRPDEAALVEAARRLVTAEDGTLRVEAAPGGLGRRLVVDLPLASGEAPGPAPHRGSPAPGGPRTFLVVDDEELIRDLMARLIGMAGHRALLAASSAEALRLLESEAVDAVLADHHMAGMSGVELHAELLARRPHLAGRFALMTGDPDSTDVVAFAALSGARIIPKSGDTGALEAAIRELAGERP